MNTKPMRLVPKKDKPTMNRRQEEALKKIRERQAKAAFGMGTVDARPEGNYIDVAAALEKSFRQVG